MSGTNNSGTGGYIIDRPPGPPTGDQITAAMQIMVSQLADLPGVLVRPRWQPTPPTQPAAGVTWASVGVIQFEADEYPYIVHDGSTTLSGETSPGVDRMQRHGTLTVLVSFYGPASEDCAGRLRDALYISQNMEPLTAFGIKPQAVHDLTRTSEIINQQFIERVDTRIELRQQIDRIYPVFDIAAAEVVLDTDTGIQDTITVTPSTVIRPGS
jgi:hypothetical protein